MPNDTNKASTQATTQESSSENVSDVQEVESFRPSGSYSGESGGPASEPKDAPAELPSDKQDDLAGLSKEELIARLRENNQDSALKGEEETNDASSTDSGDDQDGGEAAEDGTVEATLDTVSSGEGMLSQDEFNVFHKAYESEEGLTEDHFKALEDRGIPRYLVEQYVAGAEAMQANARSAIMGAAGGEESYNELIQWAGENLTTAQAERFDAAITSGDLGKAQDAVEGLVAKRQIAGSQEPGRSAVQGGSNSSSSGGYASQAELQADMQDDRYFRDPDFKAAVTAKMQRSNLEVLR